jgi:transposase InsO family protein
MNNIIEEYYENFNYPSVNKLYNLLRDDGHKDIKKVDIENYLNKKEEVQIFKENKKVKLQQGHITALKPNEKWQLDIFYLIKYHRQNKEYKYILCAIDVFTRKAYCVGMKLKDDVNVYKALNQLFDQAETYPLIITSDNDTTFLGKEIQLLFNKHNIIHDVVPKNDHNSLGIIDRFARTLKTVLHKRFVKYNTTTWINELPSIIKNYNNTPHSAIDDIKPSQADTPENIYDIIDINIQKKN